MNEARLLEAARAGDEDAFARLVEPYRRALHAHCYRMLGSVTDAEDALQEALLNAWRGLAKFEGRSSLRSWLYTIATNASLRAIERRPKRVLPVDYAPGGRPPRRRRRAPPRIGLGGALSGRDARPRGRAGRPRGALRAARERRARVRRGAPAPAGAPARRAHPPRRARLLGARGGHDARDITARGRQRPAACPQGGRRAAARPQPAGGASLTRRPGPARDRRPLRRRLRARRRRRRRRDAGRRRSVHDAAPAHLVPRARGGSSVPDRPCAEPARTAGVSSRRGRTGSWRSATTAGTWSARSSSRAASPC